MGVRGLTSFIARHAELYLTPYELHDCNLVIDGDNLACNLYKDMMAGNSAFGGDYDDFYFIIRKFFHVLAECNIQPFVLMDGGYEERKLRTVGKRLRGKISVIKRINPCESAPVFPLLMKEVFIDAVKDGKVPVMRCVFEADYELAALSRKLNCPVLSYDSDFYIHNVQYIPLITLTVKAHKKRFQESDRLPQRMLRQNEVKHLEKRTKTNRIMNNIHVNHTQRRTISGYKTFKYLDCCIYRIENLLLQRSALSKEKLPLFAALLGNDYIARNSFKNFFVGGKGGRSKKFKQQQRRIRLILNWLKHETFKSALAKILERLRKNERESLLAQVEEAISGYSNEICYSYDFFITNYSNCLKDFIRAEEKRTEIDKKSIKDDEEDKEVFEGEEQEEDVEYELEANEGEEDEICFKVNGEDIDCFEAGEEYDDEEYEIEDNEEEDEMCLKDENLKIEDFENDNNSDTTTDTNSGVNNEDIKSQSELPDWFLQKLYQANIPRFFVDLVHLKKYINSPQIEHFPYNDCHEIALPILKYIFTLLNFAEENLKKVLNFDEHNPQVKAEFTYMTRATKVTNVQYYRYGIEEHPQYTFHPHNPNPLLFRKVFENVLDPVGESKNTDVLFKNIMILPKDLQLYFLAVVYWLQKSEHCNLFHLHAIIICLVVIRTCDSKVPVERNITAFHKKCGKIIKKERDIRNKESKEGLKRKLKDEVAALPIQQRIDFVLQSDCFLVKDNLLEHFHMQDVFKKKYDLYSSVVLHAFSEFQSVVFQLYALNALLNFPYERPRLGTLYRGVLLYNLYDLLRTRIDIHYHVQTYILQDSQIMYDFYCFLYDWCKEFVPTLKQQKMEITQTVSKKILKKRKKTARKDSKKEILSGISENNAVTLIQGEPDYDSNSDFFDLNNKFCSLLKVN